MMSSFLYGTSRPYLSSGSGTDAGEGKGKVATRSLRILAAQWYRSWNVGALWSRFFPKYLSALRLWLEWAMVVPKNRYMENLPQLVEVVSASASAVAVRRFD